MSPVVADDCCDEHEPADLPGERDCDACVNVCNTIAKPLDSGDQASAQMPEAALVIIGGVSTEPLTLHPAAFCFDRAVSGMDLPFPPSDVPLLI